MPLWRLRLLSDAGEKVSQQVPPNSLVGPLLPVVEEYVAKNGKVPKMSVIYTPADVQPIPPIGWVYKCLACRFYIPGPPDATWRGLCKLVSETEGPDPGFINGESWCILDTNRADDPFLGWVKRRMKGEPDPWQ